VVSSARIEIRNRETGALRQTAVGTNGYRLLGLAPGAYDVLARAVGFRPQRRDSVELIVGQPTRIDFVMVPAVGAAELEPVVVIGNGTGGVDRMDVSTAVVEQDIERLPLNTRDALALAAIAPGVRSFAPEAGRATPTTAAANSGRMVNLYVDGTEWKGVGPNGLVGVSSAGSLIPQEAIREFRVALNPYDVEFTHGAAWMMSAVTHQGGNESHGSLFAYGQNRDLVARGSRQLEKPPYERGQLGANLRGPLVRNRLFYALSYEGQLTDNYIDVAPGRPAYAPQVWDRYAGSFRAPFRNQLGMARITGQFGAHTLDAIWLDRRLTTVSNFGTVVSGVMIAYDAALVSEYRVGTAQLRDRWVKGGFLHELSLSFLHDHDFDAPRVTGPVYQYATTQTTGRTNYPLLVVQRSTSVAERMTYRASGLAGEHTLKSGVELGRIWSEGYQPTARDGFFRFPTDTSTLPSLAQIGLGYPDPTTTDGARAAGFGDAVGGYVQDEWRPRQSLSITAGVRYDADINMLNQGRDNPWANDTTLQRVAAGYLDSRQRKNDLDNFAPRVAARWDIGGAGRTSVRAGYGRMYDRVPRTAAFYERITWSWRVFTFRTPGTTDPDELRRQVLASKGTVAPPSLQLLPDRMETPSSEQWSVGIGRRLTSSVSLQVDYLDQNFNNLPSTVQMNGGAKRVTNLFGPLILWGSFGRADYRALLTQLSMNRASTRLTVAYTLSWSHAQTLGNSDANYPDSAAYRGHVWSGNDERHRVVLSGMTDGPFGLQFSTIAIAASPHPYPVIVGTDVNGNGNITDDWPDGLREMRARGWANWYRSVDVRLGKAFGGRGGRVIATADLFNLFNTANHSEYRGTQNQPDYREPIGDYARRQAQLGMRYQF
jgi:hypothetical protein